MERTFRWSWPILMVLLPHDHPRYFLKVLDWCPLQLWGVEEGGDRPEIDFIPEKGPPVNPPHGQYLICGHLWVK